MSISLHKKTISVGGTTYYVLRNTSCDPVDLEALYDLMAEESTVTRHDVKAVVSALQRWIIYYLKEGYSVRLGDLGSFRTTLSGSGTEEADELSDDNIEYVRVQFTPSAIMEQAFLTGSGSELKFVTLSDDE